MVDPRHSTIGPVTEVRAHFAKRRTGTVAASDASIALVGGRSALVPPQLGRA